MVTAGQIECWIGAPTSSAESRVLPGLGSPQGLRAPRNFLKLGTRMRPQGYSLVLGSAHLGQELLRGLRRELPDGRGQFMVRAGLVADRVERLRDDRAQILRLEEVVTGTL